MKQMTHQTWLPLAEYSNKYRISLSTLRRRIKAEDIQYKFADGRYFIVDEPGSSTINRPSQGSFAEHRPSQENVRPQKSGTSFSSSASSSQSPNTSIRNFSGSLFQKENRMKEHDLDFIESAPPTSTKTNHEVSLKNQPNKEKDESILTAANRLLTELKKAYSQILHEKEEQILQLKEEASDLKTLVRVLESENLRMKDKR